MTGLKSTTKHRLTCGTGATVGTVSGASTRVEHGKYSKINTENIHSLRHDRPNYQQRTFNAASTLLSGILAIATSQLIGLPLKRLHPEAFKRYVARTKENFVVLVTSITQWWSPTVVRVSGDDSMNGQLFQMEDGSLKCNFPHRIVLMANHQLYTDWLYLWWTAYTNKMHGHVYIVMKESIKQIPILGWAAQFYSFIFLSRNWETDKTRLKQAFDHMKSPQDPMWLLIFPEGTNLSAVTREKSAAWSKLSNIPDMKHQLLPRATGLQFCLQQMKQSTNWLYDCTIVYEGVPAGKYGQDIYTLQSSFLEGMPPKAVNMFWRRFKISDIPISNDAAFSRWLMNRWREKDYIIEYFQHFKKFPAQGAVHALAGVHGQQKLKHARGISTEIKAGGWSEFMDIFNPVTETAAALSSIDLTEPFNFDTLMSQLPELQQFVKIKALIPPTCQQAIDNAITSVRQGKTPHAADEGLAKAKRAGKLKDMPKSIQSQ